jgi:membrane dipeptidase
MQIDRGDVMGSTEMLIIDGHSDIPRDIYQKSLDGRADVFMSDHYDLLKTGSVRILIANVFTKTKQESALPEALLQIERMISLTRNNELVVLIESRKDLEEVLVSGKTGILLSLEGFEPLGDQLDLLAVFHKLGVRAGMLTWNQKNYFASGAEAEGSLTPLGKLAIDKMNDLGMIIDVSHLNEAGFWDVINSNKSITIASHSNARRLFNHPRNLTDEQMKAIASSGGVVGAVCYFSKVDLLEPGKVRVDDDPSETIEDYIQHIEHMVQIIGYDHVAFGFDFNYYLNDFAVAGIENAGQIGNVVTRLLDKGHAFADVNKIAGGNWLRILQSTLR